MSARETKQPVVCGLCEDSGWLPDPWDSGVGMRCTCGGRAAAEDVADAPLADKTAFARTDWVAAQPCAAERCPKCGGRDWYQVGNLRCCFRCAEGFIEPILFCRRGKLPVKSRCDRNWWGWPRGKHSAKPEAFQTMVEQISPGPYLELFARRKRHGWASWGNEIANDVILTPNDPSSATRPTRAFDCNRDAMAGFAGAHG